MHSPGIGKVPSGEGHENWLGRDVEVVAFVVVKVVSRGPAVVVDVV